MAGRPAGSQNKDKPFRDALRMEAALADKGEETPALRGSLRWIARQMLNKAGEEVSAAFQIRDTLDGKPAQAITGDDELDPIRVVQEIRRSIVDPKNAGHPDSKSVPPVT